MPSVLRLNCAVGLHFFEQRYRWLVALSSRDFDPPLFVFHSRASNAKTRRGHVHLFSSRTKGRHSRGLLPLSLSLSCAVCSREKNSDRFRGFGQNPRLFERDLTEHFVGLEWRLAVRDPVPRGPRRRPSQPPGGPARTLRHQAPLADERPRQARPPREKWTHTPKDAHLSLSLSLSLERTK